MRFRDLWLVETISNTEDELGPFEDQQIVNSLRNEQISINQKIIKRATKLAHRDKITQSMDKWAMFAKIALILLALIAIFSGVGLAYGSLGASRSSINVLSLFITLLGLHLISFIFWLISLFFGKLNVTLLGRIWIWLSEKVSRSPNYVRSIHSFLTTINKAKATRWLFASVSHGFWLINLTITTIFIIILLATRSYTFNWETTILSSDSFANIVEFVGYIPSLLGFAMPSRDMILNSSNMISNLFADHETWSWWLIGQLTIWGILIRLIAFVLSFWMLRQRLRKAHIDMESGGIATLAKRLEFNAFHTYKPKDEHNRNYELENIRVSTNTIKHNLGRYAIVGIDLAPREVWPPFAPKDGISDAGILDGRTKKQKFLDSISEHPLEKVLIVLDGKQTPDRGIQYQIKNFSQYAGEISVYLLNSFDGTEISDRALVWKNILIELGISEKNIYLHESELNKWKTL